MYRHKTHPDIQSTKARNKHVLHTLNAKFTSCHKGVYCSGIKLLSALPYKIKTLDHKTKLLKSAFKDYILDHVLYFER